MTVSAELPTEDETTATERMLAALTDPSYRFTQEQLLHFVALMMENDETDMAYRAGYDAGYWARVAEENAAYPPSPYQLVTTAGQDAVRIHRSRAGVDRSEPREGDFPGMGMEYVRQLRERGKEAE